MAFFIASRSLQLYATPVGGHDCDSARTGERRCCQPVRKLEGRLRRFEQDAPPQFSRDLKSYVYTYERITSDLYVVDGLK
ncbi:MAG: hypothetical protein JO159_07905 [Acidobacteria bacterium]|nr:hypothetical protein [Acidobacteriota bacterium]